MIRTSPGGLRLLPRLSALRGAPGRTLRAAAPTAVCAALPVAGALLLRRAGPCRRRGTGGPGPARRLPPLLLPRRRGGLRAPGAVDRAAADDTDEVLDEVRGRVLAPRQG